MGFNCLRQATHAGNKMEKLPVSFARLCEVDMGACRRCPADLSIG
jgi:hypothetical protein